MSELIKISKEFKGMMGGLWLGREVTIPDGADAIECFLKEHELLEKAWAALNPHIKWNGQEMIGEINKEAERIEIAIDNCTDPAELEALQNEAIKHGLVKQFIEKKKLISQIK